MKFGLLTTLTKKINRRYAKAFFNQALKDNLDTEIQADFVMLTDTMRKIPEFRDFILSSQHPHPSYDELLEKLLKDHIQPKTVDFLKFLSHKNRLHLLRGIMDAYSDLFHAHHSISRIQVISAIPLTPQQIEKICAKLKVRWKQTVFAENVVDPQVIGGFQIKSGDRILDLSFRNQLDQYRNTVLNA